MSLCAFLGNVTLRPPVPAPYGGAQRSGKAARPHWARLLALALLGLFALAAPALAAPLRLVAFGDSLTAGYGLPANQSFPARLQAALTKAGHDVLIENAGVSGDTTSAGLARLDWSVPEGTDGVILELGANDALRGLDPSIPEKSLDALLARLKARGIPVLLAGMLAPPNLGQAYGERFNGIYGRLAATYDVPLYPFFLDGVAGHPNLVQPDGLHPTAQGVDVIVTRIQPAVEAFLAQIKARKNG
ncbi:acyl-CoA thioesterase-1 [Angulomicrobium tetraedrale]|uniref:Acyl-CoA thioesterase-1 n=1 Tax=Ancylobacter tetraedralis TaxID=217068 RepID=A0A839Z7V8_9HYPH|nr:arylesterase [Ancylobacter tetraedralis]MBB3770850.1 acyl-CoA thioesterase-1 [Ancylobacter tetraedralis]